ncbi:MAG: type IV pilus biogenesis protein PilM [Phycisphaerae bacterium]
MPHGDFLESLVLGMSGKVLSVDWDKRMLRFVVARVGRGSIKLDEAHAHRIPQGTDSEDPAAMGEFLKQTLARHRVNIKKVVVDVPRERAVINRLRLPPTPPSDLAAAVHFQALRELPFAMDEAVVDFAVMEREGPRNVTEVLLAAVRKETLKRVTDACVAAGLTPVRVGLRPYANLIAVNHLPAMLDRRVLFVEIGATTTEIDVMRGQTLAFSRAATVSVPFAAGQLVTEDSRIMAKVELQETDLADQAEDAVVGELIVEMTRTLQAYRATESNAVIDQIVIAGGTGIEHALLQAVDERFGLPAILFDPTLTLGEKDTEATKLRQFSAALGLAWGLSREGALEINFLKPKKPVPKRETLKKQARIIGLAAAMVATAAGGWVTMDFINLNRELATLGEGNTPQQEKLVDLIKVDNKLKVAREWSKRDELSMWLDHLLDLTRQTVDPGKKMIVTNVTANAESGTISLRVACDDWKVATEFVTRINDLEILGKKPFSANQGTFTESKSGDLKFKGTVPIDIDLPLLKSHEADEKSREKAWKESLRV